ncbi:MAG: YvrJ family protein [Firmicutes bacterium]|nr:YvrJ family protein [Bacillota bacterium]
MEEMLRLASSYGFPMVVAIYLLVRIEPIIRSLTRSVDTLTMMIALQNGVKAKDFEELKSDLKDKACN